MIKSCEDVVCLVAAAAMRYPTASRGGFGFVKRVRKFCCDAGIVGNLVSEEFKREQISDHDVNNVISIYKQHILDWKGVVNTEIYKKIKERLDIVYQEKDKVVTKVKKVSKENLEVVSPDVVVEDAVQIVSNYYEDLIKEKETLEREWDLLSSKMENNENKIKNLKAKFNWIKNE